MKLRKGKPEDAGMSPKQLNRVRDLAAGWVADGITPSLVVFAARKGVIVLHEAFGITGPEPDSPPLKTDTLFPLASATKLITATAAMILVEDGLLGLNRPVADYVPEFIGENKDKVMIHHILTHTSGLNEEAMEQYVAKSLGLKELPLLAESGNIFHFEHRDLLYAAPLSIQPGTEMSYCDYAFVILGEIISRVSGTSLEDVAKEKIFTPIGMKNTHFITNKTIGQNLVGRPLGAPFEEAEKGFRRVPDGSGGAYSTAADFAAFGQMFLNGGSYGGERILSPLSAREMTRNQIPGVGAKFFDEIFPEAGWGLGWMIQENKKSVRFSSLNSPGTFFHSGAGGVYFWVDPVHEIVGAYFSVEIEPWADGGHKWNADLFANALTAAVTE